MILKLPQDKRRAKGLYIRHFSVEAEDFEVVDRSAVGVKSPSITAKSMKGNKTSIRVVSPKITMKTKEASLLISPHPKLEGIYGVNLKIIYPEMKEVERGFMLAGTTTLSKKEVEELPYHFRITILTHGPSRES